MLTTECIKYIISVDTIHGCKHLLPTFIDLIKNVLRQYNEEFTLKKIHKSIFFTQIEKEIVWLYRHRRRGNIHFSYVSQNHDLYDVISDCFTLLYIHE